MTDKTEYYVIEERWSGTLSWFKRYGSFKSLKDAESRKAKLAKIGKGEFDYRIVRVTEELAE